MPPVDPATLPDEDREEVEEQWWHFWAGHSQELRQFLAEMREIESLAVQGTVETGKLGLIKEKQRRIQRMLKAWACPSPPWREVPANLLWNIHNAPAAQISMMGRITGLTFAPVAACATFGVTLKLAMDAIRRGEAKVVVIGATDPPPLRLMVGRVPQRAGRGGRRLGLQTDDRVARHPRRGRRGGLDRR